MNNIGKTMLFLSSISGIGKKMIYSINEKSYKMVRDKSDMIVLAKELASKSKKIKLFDDDVLKKSIYHIEDILDKHTNDNIIMITKYDNEYPVSLHQLSKPVPYFFAKGNIDSLKKDGIAIVGTRKCSSYGEKIGIRFGEVIAENGLTVISGLAEGCDTSGHRGCLYANGITIVTMPTPLNEVFPKKNENLRDEILNKKGCLISEYMYGEQTTKFSFVERNRLQCGLANGMIIVETESKSGTHHAINGAIKLGKPVGCFKYNDEHYLQNIHVIGNKRLIEQGKAIPLYDKKSIAAFLKLCNDRKKNNICYQQGDLF